MRVFQSFFKTVLFTAVFFVSSFSLFAQKSKPLEEKQQTRSSVSQSTAAKVPATQNTVLSSTTRNNSTYPSIQPLFTAETELGYNPPAILSADEVLTLSLLFSKCPLDSSSAQSALKKFERIKKEVSSSRYMRMSEEERGEAVLRYLYSNTLIEYNEDQSKLNTIFETGYYNCVSASLLYMAAAKAAGLEVRGQKTPLHAFCTIYVKDKATGKKSKIDVETTNPYGFNPGSTGTIETDNMTMYYTVPEANYSDRQEVSDKIFTGLIANNLCVDYLNYNDYFSAIPIMGALYNLIRDENSVAQRQIRDDFFGFPNSYVATRISDINTCTATEYADLLHWFASFIERWGKNTLIQQNMDSAFNNLLVLCYQEKNYNLADSSYKELKPYISQKQLSESESILTELLLLTMTEGVAPRDQINLITEQLNSRKMSAEQKERFLLVLENAWYTILVEHMNNYDFQAGYKDALIAESQIPTSDTLRQITQIFYTNCIVEIHNNFVIQANKGNYKESKKILDKGLADFPGDKTLQQDLATIKQVLR